MTADEMIAIRGGEPKRHTWKKTIRILKGRLYITLSNCRVKKRDVCGYNRAGKLADNLRDIKGKLYESNNHLCPHCKNEFDINEMELHHVLPWARYPELRATKKNVLLLCHYCHKEIHCNPFLNIRLMQDKAKELGIDLNDRYAI